MSWKIPFETCHRRLLCHSPSTIRTVPDTRQEIQDIRPANIAETIDARIPTIAVRRPTDWFGNKSRAWVVRTAHSFHGSKFARKKTFKITIKFYLSNYSSFNRNR